MIGRLPSSVAAAASDIADGVRARLAVAHIALTGDRSLTLTMIEEETESWLM